MEAIVNVKQIRNVMMGALTLALLGACKQKSEALAVETAALAPSPAADNTAPAATSESNGAASAGNEQYFPLQSYRVGPYAAGGTGFFGGFIDYLQLVNARDGGVGGVKLTWSEC